MNRYFCPVCRAPRKANFQDELPIRIHLRIAASVAVVSSISYLISGFELAWRTAFLYLPLWAVSEFMHWVRMREATKCQACGFDPILYKRDWRAARKQVENRLGDVVEELRVRGHFIPPKLRQLAPQGQAMEANKEALASQAPPTLAGPTVTTPKTTTRSVSPASLQDKDKNL